MKRVPVQLRVTRLVPGGFAAWVPWPRTILLNRKYANHPQLQAMIAHELNHVLQWEEYGWRFPFMYFRELLAGGYHGNDFEEEAYANDNESAEMMAWAKLVIREAGL